MAVNPIPDGYHSVTPYLSIDGAASAIEYYKQAFGALELLRIPGPDGKIGHAEIKIGDSVIMMADEFPQMNFKGPRSRGGATSLILLYVPDVDAQLKLAVTAGAKVLRPLEDQFYGDRTATVEDPFGHVWTLATHKEDVSPEELQKRAAAQKK